MQLYPASPQRGQKVTAPSVLTNDSEVLKCVSAPEMLATNVEGEIMPCNRLKTLFKGCIRQYQLGAFSY